MSHALLLREKKARAGKVYYPLKLQLMTKPTPGPNELLVKIHAAALNRRDLFIRQNLYPNISFQTPLLSDGYGVVAEAGPCASRDLLGQPVLLTPCRGWAASADGPEEENWATFGAIGGVGPGTDLGGTAQRWMVVHESEVEPCPAHLSAVEAAALPTCGLTGWRALVTKSGNARPGHNILVTGIGGGVALQVLQFGLALGCNVYVTSGSEAKIARALQLGAKGACCIRMESGTGPWEGCFQRNDPIWTRWWMGLAEILPSRRRHSSSPGVLSPATA